MCSWGEGELHILLLCHLDLLLLIHFFLQNPTEFAERRKLLMYVKNLPECTQSHSEHLLILNVMLLYTYKCCCQNRSIPNCPSGWRLDWSVVYTIKKKKINLVFYFWLHWVFTAAHRLSLVAVMGFSLRWLLLLRSTNSRHTGFSSCGTQAQ